MLSGTESLESGSGTAVLSAERRSDVESKESTKDVADMHLNGWSEERQARMLARQREEILRHKWIESEKAQRDLGAEAALDWIKRYAAQWRRWYEQEGEPKKA